MVILDISIVNVALPSIRSALDFDPTGLQWIVNAYTLTFAGFLLLGGRAADMFGQRRLFLLGVVVFGGASIAGGLSSDRGLLIAARGLQGFGGAILSPATLTILTTTFSEPRERARAMGIWGSVGGAGGAAGALLGGLLTDLVSWRSIFLLNVPIALLACIGGTRLLVLRNERHSSALDATGAVLVTGGLVAVVYGIVSSEQFGWTSDRVLGSFIGGLALLGWFVVHEGRVAREPIMPLGLWKIPSLAAANLVMLLMSMGMFAMWFFISLDVQTVRGFSPIRAGFVFLPQTIAIVVGAQLSSRLMQRVGARTLAIIAMVIGVAGMYWLSRSIGNSDLLANELVPGTVITFGLGLAITPVISSAMQGVDQSMAGLASGLINTSRQVGGSIGLAVLITLANERTGEILHTVSTGAGLVSGYERGLEVGAWLMAGSIVFACMLPPTPATKTPKARAPTEVA
jgi:EmrB/QacA subfamily drug resistance transporter